MHGSLSFDIDAAHFARQLDLKLDRPALAALGGRCADYLRLALSGHLDAHDAPRLFPDMLRPSRVPAERGIVLGIHAAPVSGGRRPPRLVGILYFLHPHSRGDTWFITLLLLEPSARGKGLGSAIYRVFERWAASRGARRLVVAVSDKNPRARRFWRDRMGYREIHPSTDPLDGEPKHREFERWLTDLEGHTSAWIDHEFDPTLGKG